VKMLSLMVPIGSALKHILLKYNY